MTPTQQQTFQRAACGDLLCSSGYNAQRYRQNIVWLKAFRDSGWRGQRAIDAAEKALAEYLSKNNQTRLIE